MLGCFLNTALVRLTPARAIPDARALVDAHQRFSDALAHGTAPFNEVMKRVAAATGQPAPVSDIAFGFRTSLRGHWAVEESRIEQIEVDRRLTKFGLELQIVDHRGSITGYFDYDPRQLSRKEVDRLRTRLLELLAASCAGVEAPMGKR
jgi:hypothetical protein